MTHPGCTLRSEIQSGSKIAPFIGIPDGLFVPAALFGHMATVEIGEHRFDFSHHA